MQRKNFIVFRVEKQEKELIKNMADLENISVTKLIRKALRYYLDKINNGI